MRARARFSGADLLAQVEALDELIDEHQDVAGLLDRSSVLRETSRRVRDRTRLDLGYAAQLEDPDLMVIRGWSGATGTRLRNLEVPRGLGLGGKSLALVRPVWVPDYCASAQITHEFDAVIRSERIGAMAAVPLVRGDQVLGVIYAARRGAGDIGDVVVGQMEELAGTSAAALHLAARVHGQATVALAAERRRIAVALHDSVGAMLFSLGAEVRDLQADALEAPALLARLRSVESRISETAAVFRESLAVLDVVQPTQALTAALRGDSDAFARRTGVTTRCVALTDVPALDDAHRAAIVAVVREALVNVEKHANASSVVVSVAATAGGVAVAVADDGQGWPEAGERAAAEQLAARARTAGPDGCPRPVTGTSSGIGLTASYDRLARVGGSMSIVGNEDGGLTMRAWVPVT
ncbi:MAG: GAF domain-containing sensor histidine kinase [Jatrophihabitantaceae bacterium]